VRTGIRHPSAAAVAGFSDADLRDDLAFFAGNPTRQFRARPADGFTLIVRRQPRAEEPSRFLRIRCRAAWPPREDTDAWLSQLFFRALRPEWPVEKVKSEAALALGGGGAP
jgi:hypothetical protein